VASNAYAGQKQQSQGPPQPAQTRPPALQMPYVPSAEEQGYLAECAKAIVAGSDAAATAAAASNADDFQKYAAGVKSLTAAYVEIKTGGRAATGHQGS
jgi:hypothetical protein